MPMRSLDILCTAYCGCGHCCGWEWGLTLPGGLYLALGDPHEEAKGYRHGAHCTEDTGEHSLAHRLGHPMQRLKRMSASLSATFENPWQRFKVKKRKERPGCFPGLFCKYWIQTAQLGQPYEGMTSAGTYPRQARATVTKSLQRHPLAAVQRVLLPWMLPPKVGTIAADTKHFPHGTKMLVPGYGWAQVQDEGSAITGEYHVDLFHDNHGDALVWGKRKLKVLVYPPPKHGLEAPKYGPFRPVIRVAINIWSKIVGVHHDHDDNIDCKGEH